MIEDSSSWQAALNYEGTLLRVLWTSSRSRRNKPNFINTITSTVLFFNHTEPINLSQAAALNYDGTSRCFGLSLGRVGEMSQASSTLANLPFYSSTAQSTSTYLNQHCEPRGRGVLYSTGWLVFLDLYEKLPILDSKLLVWRPLFLRSDVWYPQK